MQEEAQNSLDTVPMRTETSVLKSVKKPRNILRIVIIIWVLLLIMVISIIFIKFLQQKTAHDKITISRNELEGDMDGYETELVDEEQEVPMEPYVDRRLRVVPQDEKVNLPPDNISPYTPTENTIFYVRKESLGGMEPGTFSARTIINAPFLYKEEAVVSPDKAKIAYTRKLSSNKSEGTTCEDPCYYVGRVVELRTGKVETFFTTKSENTEDSFIRWSDDNYTIIYSLGEEIWKYDTVTDKKTLLTRVTGYMDNANGSPYFQIIGTDLYFQGINKIEKLSVTNPTQPEVFFKNTDPKRKMYQFMLSPDRNSLVYKIADSNDQPTATDVLMYNLKSKKKLVLIDETPSAYADAFSSDGKRFLVYHGGAGDSPGEYVLYTSEGSLIQKFPNESMIKAAGVTSPFFGSTVRFQNNNDKLVISASRWENLSDFRGEFIFETDTTGKNISYIPQLFQKEEDNMLNIISW